MPKLTLAQLRDIVGEPVVLLQVYDPKLGRTIELTAADLGPQLLQAIIDFYDAHLGNR